MNADERQHQIVALARRQGEVDVAKLAAELTVSPETIRRDLRLLEKHGLLRRTHGGAYPVETARFETTLACPHHPRGRRRNGGSRPPRPGCSATPRRSSSTRASPRS